MPEPVRVRVTLDDALVAQLDARVGRGGRGRFIGEAVRQRVADEQRWDSLMAAGGSIEDGGHEWDHDAAEWVARHAAVTLT